MNNRTLLILLGVAGVAGLAAVLLAAGEDAPAPGDKLGSFRNAVRQYFEIGPGCENIAFEGDSEDFGEDVRALLGEILPAAETRGLEGADEITEFMLIQVLPECPIPPEGGFEARPDLALIFTAMRGHVLAALNQTELPDVTDEGTTLPLPVTLDPDFGKPDPGVSEPEGPGLTFG